MLLTRKHQIEVSFKVVPYLVLVLCCIEYESPYLQTTWGETDEIAS